MKPYAVQLGSFNNLVFLGGSQLLEFQMDPDVVFVQVGPDGHKWSKQAHHFGSVVCNTYNSVPWKGFNFRPDANDNKVSIQGPDGAPMFPVPV